MNGSDWRSYETIYDFLTLNFSDYNPLIHLEIGFYSLQFLFNYVGVGFWSFFIAIKFICFLVFSKVIYSFSAKMYFLNLACFLSFFGLYLFIDAPLRSVIAIAVFLLSLNYLMNKRIIMFFLTVFIGSLFHGASIFLVVLYFVVYREYKTTTLIVGFVAINLAVALLMPVIIGALGFLLGNISFLSSKVENYIENKSEFGLTSSFLSLGYLIRVILFIVMIKLRSVIENIFGRIYFNLIMIYFFTYVLALGFSVFYRINLYFSVFFVLAFCCSIFLVQSKLKLGSLLFFTIYCFLNTFLIVTHDYKYVPYTSYLNYIFEEKPSFYYRSNYNYKHSPFTNPEDMKKTEDI
jgi:hypothetical protein